MSDVVASRIIGSGSPDEITARLEALFRLGTSVAAAENENGALEAIVDQAAGIAGASAAVIGLIDRDHIDVVASRGYAPGNIDDWATFPLEPGTPMTDAIALGEAIFCSNREERDRLWPVFAGRGDSIALGVLPLLGRAGVLGALFLGYGEERAFDAEERSFLQAFASHAPSRSNGLVPSPPSGSSGSSSRSLRRERCARELARLRGDAGPGRVARRAGFCDWVACDLLVDGRVELAAVAHVDPEKARGRGGFARPSRSTWRWTAACPQSCAPAQRALRDGAGGGARSGRPLAGGARAHAPDRVQLGADRAPGRARAGARRAHARLGRVGTPLREPRRRARGGAGAAGRPGDRQRPPLSRPAGRARLRAVREGADGAPAAVLDAPRSRDDRRMRWPRSPSTRRSWPRGRRPRCLRSRPRTGRRSRSCTSRHAFPRGR